MLSADGTDIPYNTVLHLAKRKFCIRMTGFMVLPVWYFVRCRQYERHARGANANQTRKQVKRQKQKEHDQRLLHESHLSPPDINKGKRPPLVRKWPLQHFSTTHPRISHTAIT